MRYKPSKIPFLYFWFAKLFLVSVFFVGVAVLTSFVLFEERALLVTTVLLVLLVAFLLYSGVSRFVRYYKEEYVFFDDRIVKKTGGLFSDTSVELLVKKITNVRQTLPFVETSVFGTGTISVESAGSGGTEVFMVSLEDTKKTYNHVEKLMRSNGFVIDKKTVVQREIPSWIGSFFELGPAIFSFVLFLYFAMLPLLDQVARGDFYVVDQGYVSVISFSVLFLVFLYALSVGVVRYIDLIKRTYTLYDDCVTYEEGFLTKVYSLIPVENLADSKVSQSVFHRVFGIYDIVISCQGSGNQIIFKSMYNGDVFKDNLDGLIKDTESLALEVVGDGQKTGDKQYHVGRMRGFTTSDLKISYSRYSFLLLVLLPFSFVLLPFLPIILILLVSRWVEVFATSYSLNEDTVEMNYKFIRTQHVEFSNDKITGIVVKENFVDRWFNTVSITFWSIGSDNDIVFKYVSKKNDLVRNILESEGYLDEEVKTSLKPSFDVHSFVVGNPLASTLFGLGLGASFILGFSQSFYHFVSVLLFIIILILGVWRYKYYEKAEFDFYDSYLYYKKGFLFKTSYYVDFSDVKDVNTKKYWYLDKGTVTVGVAGESALDQQATNFLPYGFSVKYVRDCFVSDVRINQFLGTDLRDENVLRVSKPDYRNTFVRVGLIGLLFTFLSFTSVLIWDLSLILPVSVILVSVLLVVYVVLSVLVTAYKASDKALYRLKGILYRQRKTVLHNRIDHLNKKTGFLNKVFKNGTVLVYNTGSSLVEMRISDISDFEGFFKDVQKHYN